VTAATALLLGVGAGVAVAIATASPALAAVCWSENSTINVTSAGNWVGTAGHDVVVISANGATYNPNGGSDSICITASLGTTVWFSGSGHLIQGGPGPDTIYGSNGVDHIYGGGGADLLKGNGADDYIQGDAGNDYLLGNSGVDTLIGYDGADCILGGPDGDFLYGGNGNDTLLVGYEFRYSATECAPAENDNSTAAQNFRNNLDAAGGGANGDDGHDRIWGSNGPDSLIGGVNSDGYDGNDVINGWRGNDTISGGAGTDILKGGYGVDWVHGEMGWFDAVYGGSDSGDLTYGDSTDTCYPDNGPATTPCLGA
jgi:Ca2+-binding RTX toxin-like protein